MTTIALEARPTHGTWDGRMVCNDTYGGPAVSPKHNPNGITCQDCRTALNLDEETTVEKTELDADFIYNRLWIIAQEAKRAKKNSNEAVIDDAMAKMAAVWEMAFKAGQTHGLEAAFGNAFAEAPANPFLQ
jgi:hypothetical protein